MMKPPAPPRVAEPTQYWEWPPPERSGRLTFWLQRLKDGWRPNRRISTLGYSEAANYYGVYYWEYLNVLSQAIRLACGEDVWEAAEKAVTRALAVATTSGRVELTIHGSTIAMPFAVGETPKQVTERLLREVQRLTGAYPPAAAQGAAA